MLQMTQEISARSCGEALCKAGQLQATNMPDGRRLGALFSAKKTENQVAESGMRKICMSGSMSGMWKRSHGRTSEAQPDERRGTDMFEPKATAPHLDSSPPSFFWPSPARALNCSSVQPALPTPITGTSRWPRLSGRGAMEISSFRRDHRSGRKGPCVGPGLTHGVPDLSTPAFSRCPPNSYRIAESSLFWKSASPRELKRS
jgi:hypothetical protein